MPTDWQDVSTDLSSSSVDTVQKSLFIIIIISIISIIISIIIIIIIIIITITVIRKKQIMRGD